MRAGVGVKWLPGCGWAKVAVSHLARLNEDDDKTDRCPEDASQHSSSSAHGIQAGLDLPGWQPPHEQQPACGPKRPAHLRKPPA